MFVGEVHDKKGDDIHEGDIVFTTLQEGSHEGKVGSTRVNSSLPGNTLLTVKRSIRSSRMEPLRAKKVSPATHRQV